MRQLQWALTSLAILSLCMVLHPGLRGFARSKIFRPHRKLLSMVSGDVFHNGSTASVYKVQTEQGLFIEVYGHDRLLSRLPLPHARNGFYNFAGKISDLALQDNNGELEIVAPTYDEHLVPRLNIFHYSPQRARIEPVESGL